MVVNYEINPETREYEAVPKPSDFQDVKTILAICGPRAKRHAVPFRRIFDLAIFCIYNYPDHTPKDIGDQLDTIFASVHDPDLDWFFDDWVHVYRNGKDTLEILEAVANLTKLESEIPIEDVAYYIGSGDTLELGEIILTYYRDGCPPIL